MLLVKSHWVVDYHNLFKFNFLFTVQKLHYGPKPHDMKMCSDKCCNVKAEFFFRGFFIFLMQFLNFWTFKIQTLKKWHIKYWNFSGSLGKQKTLIMGTKSSLDRRRFSVRPVPCWKGSGVGVLSDAWTKLPKPATLEWKRSHLWQF